MSIIYNTLERLEADNSGLAYNKDKTSSPGLTAESGSFPVKTVAKAAMVVIAVASLLSWQQSGEMAAPQLLASATATQQSVTQEKPGHELSPVSIEEQAALPLEPTEPSSELPTPRDVATVVPVPTEEVAVTAKQPNAIKEEPREINTIEAPVIVADTSVDVVSSPVARQEGKPAEPDEPEQLLVSDAFQYGRVDAVVRQARVALSRGQYQQALSTLEALAPVPENRPDYWLIKGSAHLGIGQLEPAGMAFSSAQSLAPGNAQIAVQQAVLQQEKGDHISALQILKSASIRHPNVPEIFLNQGYSQQALGAVQDAKRSFREFLQMTEGRSLYLQQRKLIKEWLAQVSAR